MSANQQLNESDLLQLFRNGDRQAAADLYHMFYKGLVYFARQLIEHGAEAEDIAQETIIKLFNKKQDFDTLADVKSFIYVTARNACFNYLKARNRHELSHKELLYLSEQGEEKAELEMLKSRVLMELFKEAEALPPQCGEIFRMLYYERMGTAEVASRLGLSPQTVLNQKARAIRLLRLKLTGKGLLSLLVFLKSSNSFPF